MKKLTLVSAALVTLGSITASAHGSIAHQASEAVAVASAQFTAAQPRDVNRAVVSVNAALTGHEQFTVTINLKTGAAFSYSCAENEDVDPVVWECAAQ